MDLFGLLLKLTHGHECMVVIVDYATRCPEAALKLDTHTKDLLTFLLVFAVKV